MSERVRSEARLRADVEAILRSAIEAVEPGRLVQRALESHLRGIPAEGRIFVAGFGKATLAMAQAVHRVLGPRVEAGVLVTPPGAPAYVAPQYEIFRGGHPLPDPASVAGARAIRQLAREAGEDDLLICLVSGGGSSLLALPPEEMPLEDVRRVTEALIRAGAPIDELNCVRKHLDALKGGQLAREAAPARVLAFVLSDVPGDDLDVIASGPLSPDPTCFADAVDVLRRRGLWERAPLAARGWLDRGLSGEAPETPKRGDPLFLRTTCEIVGSGGTAAAAAVAEAARLGYEAQMLTHTLGGEARDAGAFLAETARVIVQTPAEDPQPACIVSCGETTVALRGEGSGGRNQELALGAAIGIAGLEGVVIASMGTDGIDGPTDAAGAIAAGTTLVRAEALGLDAQAALAGNDAYPFFAALDDLIVSGPTGTNVADLQVVLIERRARPG